MGNKLKWNGCWERLEPVYAVEVHWGPFQASLRYRARLARAIVV